MNKLIPALVLALTLPRAFAAGPVEAPVSERPGLEAPVAPAVVFPTWDSIDETQRASIVQRQIDAWTAQGVVEAIPAEALSAEIQSMELVETTLAQYAGDKLAALQDARKAATERRGAIRAERVAAGAAKLAQLANDTLDAAPNDGRLISVVAGLGSQGAMTEEGRLAAAETLGRRLTATYDLDHGRAAVDGLLRVGLSAQSEPARRAVVEAFSRDLLGAVSPVAVLDAQRELQAMTAVAQASQDRETRGLAAATAYKLSGFAPRSESRQLLDFLIQPRRPHFLAEAARTALGQLAVSGPAVRVQAAPNDSASFAAMRRAAQAWKWRVRIAGALLGVSALGLIGSLGLGAAGVAFGLGLLVFLQGLANHRGVFGFVQAWSLVGGAFAAAAALAASTGPLGAAGLAIVVGYAAVMAGVATWSFKVQRPWLGLLLNLILLALL